MTQITFADTVTYELYEQIDEEYPEKFSDIELAFDTLNMSMSENKFLVEVKTSRLVLKP